MRPSILAVSSLSAGAFAASASAGVIASTVATSVLFSGTGGSVNYGAGINRQGGLADTGTLIGQFGTNTPIRGRWTAQAVGGAGAGANGGNVYAVTVQIGSILQVGPFAQTYTQPVINPTDRIGGGVIDFASIGFGVGGGGLRFDDFGGNNQILIDNTGTFGDANYRMRVDPNFEPNGISGLPSLMSTYATIASDGSVGFATTFSVSSLYVGVTDVSSFFAGNLAEYQIRGFNSSFFVEVVQVPAPGALAVLGAATFVGRGRQRRR